MDSRFYRLFVATEAPADGLNAEVCEGVVDYKMRNGKATITRSGENSKVVRLQQPKEMFHTDSLASQNVPYYNPCSLLQFGNIKRFKKQKNLRVLSFLQRLHTVRTFLQRFKMGGFSKL